MIMTNIYVLIDPETKQVRYVGKSNNIAERYKAHLNNARKHQVHKANWISSLKTKGLKPIIQVVDEVPIEDWIFWETYWISQFKTWGFNLLNYTKGGDGATFANQTSFKKGHQSWNKGKSNTKECSICGELFKVFPASSEKRKTCSHKCGAILKKQSTKSTQFKSNSNPWNKGLKYKHSKINLK